MELTHTTLTISAFGVTHHGCIDIPTGINQDTFCLNPEHQIFGVFDGHGFGGKIVADELQRRFSRITDTTNQTIEHVFAQAENDIKRLVGQSVADGGSTASVLCVDEIGAVKVFHVGDSEVRYYDKPADDGIDDGIALTYDHSATSVDEYKRIKTLGIPVKFEFGQCPLYYPPRPVFVNDPDPIINPEGGFAYSTIRNDFNAYVIGPMNERLAMTRSIGDYNMKKMNGVISATPSVLHAPPPPAGVRRAIVIASDGLWDGMKYDMVGDIVNNADTSEAAAKTLLDISLNINKRLFGGESDNVTIIVLFVTVS